MRIRLGHAPLFACLVALTCLPFASCGSGPTVTPEFAELVIGPTGGHAEAQNVVLDVPPGAFTVEHVLAILPQVDLLPIADAGVDYYHNITCIGPLGLGLDVLGHVRCCYDPLGLPSGATEADLVLLEWDDVDQVMRVSLDAVQDLVGHCFDDFGYDFLGHIAIGIRTGPAFDLVLLPDGLVSLGFRGTAGGTLYLASSTDALPPSLLTGTPNATAFIPSTNGARVLFRSVDVLSESQSLHSVDVSTDDARSLTSSADGQDSGDPNFGWVRNQDKGFFIRAGSSAGSGVVPEGLVTSYFDVFAEVPGDGSTGRTDVHAVPNGYYVTDVRQSPDGTMVLLRSTDYGYPTQTSRLDVITPDGALVGSDIPGIVDAGTSLAPRWLPDSSGVYFVDGSGQNVMRVDPDGSNLGVLYSLGASFDVIRDFVVSPDYDAGDLAASHCAYVVQENLSVGAVHAPRLIAGPDDCFVVDRLTGGAALLDCGFPDGSILEEMVYHPDGKSILLDVEVFDGNFYTQTTFVYDASTATLITSFLAGLQRFDVSRDTGRILVALTSFGKGGPALVRYDADWTNETVLDLGALNPGVPRWLHSWRTAPSQFASQVR